MSLNFTNTLYVSSNYDLDVLSIVILLPYSFKTFDDQFLIENYTMTTELPSMGKASEMKVLVQTAEKAGSAMIYTLLVPLGFSVFMSFGMEKVWCLYLML